MYTRQKQTLGLLLEEKWYVVHIDLACFIGRSFPTHRSLKGESPEAIEDQAKLFRFLTAYAKYNPQVGYSQGHTVYGFETVSSATSFS